MTLKITIKVIRCHWVKERIKKIMKYHHTKFELPKAIHKIYMNVQSCIMSTIIFISILQFFRQENPLNAKIVISIK